MKAIENVNTWWLRGRAVQNDPEASALAHLRQTREERRRWANLGRELLALLTNTQSSEIRIRNVVEG